MRWYIWGLTAATMRLLLLGGSLATNDGQTTSRVCAPTYGGWALACGYVPPEDFFKQGNIPPERGSMYGWGDTIPPRSRRVGLNPLLVGFAIGVVYKLACVHEYTVLARVWK